MSRFGKIKRVGSRSAIFCFAALFSSLLTSSACTKATDNRRAASTDPITLTIGFPNVTGEDPLRGIQQAARLISLEGLVSLSRDGHAVPRLAAKWTNSSDGLSWTIELRPNALFHDGTTVDSEAIKQSLEKSIASADSDLSPGLADILSIETTKPLELVIHLRNRSTFLLDDLTVPIAKSGSGGSAIGTGPYITVSSSSNQIAMDSFPRYYRGTPNIDKVVWKPYPTVRTAWAAMMRGEVDFLYEVGQDAREFIQGENSTTIFPFLRNYVYGVVFNSGHGAFRNSQVRRALSYAVDRSVIVSQAFKGHARSASGSGWPEHWAFDPTVPGPSYDPARASALLDAAGIHSSRSDLTGPPARLHFTCLFPENLPLWERIGLLVQRNLSEIGVDMQLKSLPIAQFNERLRSRDFDAVLLELVVGNSATRPYFFWHSQSKVNSWGYENPLLDRALDGIRRAGSDAEYRDAYRRFQVETLNDPPAIFLALGETSRAVSKRFRVVAPPGTDILPTIADWQLANDATGKTN